VITRRRYLYPTTDTTNNHAPGVIGTHDRSRRVAVDLRLDRAVTGTGVLGYYAT
jgi:hypothetical protein